ncbi:MAG: oligosaccharide flippase family protein, partial [Candidatus Altiarchaeota archaeon]|nr:oligosaccharide flippase family protein [Candidatus Altiarchaeota archaeon]
MKHALSIKDFMVNASITMLFLLGMSRFLGYLFHMAFARYFTQEIYGQFIYLWSAGLFLASITPNISAAVGRYIAFERGRENNHNVEQIKNTGFILTIIMVIASSSLAVGLYLLDLIPKVDNLPAFAFIVLVSFFTISSNTLSQIITGYRRPDVSSAFNTLFNLFRFLAVVVAAYVLSTLFGALLYSVLGYSLFLVFLFFYVKAKYGLSIGFNFEKAKEIFSFGFYSLFQETATTLLTWANIFIINILLGASYVAVYNIAWLSSTLS